VRHDEPHAPTCFVIDETVTLVAKDHEAGNRGQRLLEHRVGGVDQSLRLCPLPVEARFAEFVIWHDVGSGDRLLELGEKMARRCRIELCVCFQVKPLIMRIDAKLVCDVGGLDDDILRIERRGRALDKPCGLLEHAHP
jgi:hypothetical protein